MTPADADPGGPPPDGGRDFWVFVDLGTAQPTYYLAPRWWVRNNIHEVHTAFLAKHGGVRPNAPESKHHAIPFSRVQEWRDRWDVLGVLPPTESGA